MLQGNYYKSTALSLASRDIFTEHMSTLRSHGFVSVAKAGTTGQKMLCIGETPGKPAGKRRPLWITIQGHLY